MKCATATIHHARSTKRAQRCTFFAGCFLAVIELMNAFEIEHRHLACIHIHPTANLSSGAFSTTKMEKKGNQKQALITISHNVKKEWHFKHLQVELFAHFHDYNQANSRKIILGKYSAAKMWLWEWLHWDPRLLHTLDESTRKCKWHDFVNRKLHLNINGMQKKKLKCTSNGFLFFFD